MFEFIGDWLNSLAPQEEQPEAEMLTELYAGIENEEDRGTLTEMASKAGYTLTVSRTFEERERTAK